MNGFAPMLTGWSAGAATGLLAAIWEGALLAGLVWLALRLLPGLGAAARSAVWLNVFILVALLHLVSFVPGAPVMGPAMTAHAVRIDPRWSLLVAAVWVVLSLARAGQLAAGALQLRRMARRAEPMEAAPEIRALLEHNGRPVELCKSREVARPSVLGFFRPRILVPPILMERLTTSELKQVVLQEMEHLLLGDDLPNLLLNVGLVLFALHPALAWVERRLCAERELACDDRVLRSGSGRKAYALCLAHLAEYSLVRRGFGLMLGAWERRPELARRVHRILRQPARGMARRPALAVAGGLVAGALGCALALAHAPELVSFAPTQATQTQMAASLDVQRVSRMLGGTPHMVKAVLPARNEEQGNTQPVRRAVARRAGHRTVPASRLAGLRMGAPPQGGSLLVMTQWTDEEAPAQMVVAISRAPQAKSTATAMYATFAVVRTPSGWLVIQI